MLAVQYVGIDFVERNGIGFVERNGIDFVERNGIDFVERNGIDFVERNGIGIDVVAKEKIDEIGFVKKSVSVAVTFVEYPFLI